MKITRKHHKNEHKAMNFQTNSPKPVYHFEEHDGDWAEDDWKQWRQAAHDFHGDEEFADWDSYEPEVVNRKLLGSEDKGHFFGRREEGHETKKDGHFFTSLKHK